MHIDIHALHTVPYSNLNRDALGSPKSCIYGGVPRSRVSSQSWKRAVRHQVEHEIDEPTIRTRRIAPAVQQHLAEYHGWDTTTARKGGRAVMSAVASSSSDSTGGLHPGDDGDNTDVLLWVPTSVVADLAELCTQHHDAIAHTALPDTSSGKKTKAKTKGEPVLPTEQVADVLDRRSPTINLLGRMLAEMPGHNVDGAVSFAHAITTHAADADFDFFTAVDDSPSPEHRGSGHMSTAEFTTGTFYRYSSINLARFQENLGGDLDDALRVVDTYLRAFSTAMPGGKQNVTAALTAPDLVHIALRDMPLSLAPAFDEPVRSTGGFASASLTALNTYAAAVTGLLGAPAHASGYATTSPQDRDQLGQRHDSIPSLVQAITDAATDHIEAAA